VGDLAKKQGVDTMSMQINPCTYLEEVSEIAREAGQRILEVYERAFTVVKKEDGSPLTEADHAAHRLIVSRLVAMTPDLPVLSEESAVVAYEERARWEWFWLVDPLDGTKEFVNRNGEFTVNIALIEGARPVLGVVHVPVTGVTYLACQDGGAFKEGPGAPRQAIRAGHYRGGKARLAGSRSHASTQLASFIARLTAAEGEPELLSMGSSLKLCLVAEGAADVYPRLGPTSEWDTAAAQCVVEVAGGRVTDLEMRPLIYNKPSQLNPRFLVSDNGDYDWTVYLNGE